MFQSFKELLSVYKIAFRDRVDLIMLLLAVILGLVDLIFTVDLKGGILFFACYIFALLGRLGWYKYASAKYVKDPEARQDLHLPPLN